jgi:Domain of unknown function (DUF4440)/Domain of unknown function (DUF3471)
VNQRCAYKILGKAIMFCIVFFVVPTSRATAFAESSTITLSELQQRTQELWDALAPGNKGPWRQMIADDAMIFDENGHDLDKASLLATVEKLPEGYNGSIQIVDAKARFGTKVAVLSYNANETETVFGTVLHARYHMTDTWLYRNGQWQIVASQVLRYYEDPAAMQLKSTQLDEYVGRYQLAAGRIVTITRKGDQLYGQHAPGKPYPLMAECPDLFFRPGAEGRRLFRRDRSGRIDAMIDRRNNEDLVWKRVQ